MSQALNTEVSPRRTDSGVDHAGCHRFADTLGEICGKKSFHPFRPVQELPLDNQLLFKMPSENNEMSASSNSVDLEYE